MDVDGDPVPDGWIFHSSVDVRRKNHAVGAFVVCAMTVTGTGTGRRGGAGSGGARSAHAPAPRAPTYAAGPRGRCSLPRHPRSRSVGGRGHAAAHTADGDDSTTPHHPRAEDLVKFRGQTIAGLSRTQPEPKPKPRFVACSVLFDTAFFMIQIRAWAFFLLLLEELAVVVE